MDKLIIIREILQALFGNYDSHASMSVNQSAKNHHLRDLDFNESDMAFDVSHSKQETD